MNSLVCISKTPDTTAKISFVDGNTAFNEDGVSFILNPYDEWYALVRAIELKEEKGGKVTVINVGDPSNDIIIRKALAIGADEAVRINKKAESSADVALQVAEYVKNNNFDIIFLGKETIDYNGAEVGAMIAEHLDLDYVSFASKMESNDDGFKVTRDIEGGIEEIALSAPFVISAAKGLAEQRIPNMKGIMMAKRKPLNVVEPVGFNGHVNVASFSLPSEKGGVTMVDPENMEELVRLLKEEAKVL